MKKKLLSAGLALAVLLGAASAAAAGKADYAREKK